MHSISHFNEQNWSDVTNLLLFQCSCYCLRVSGGNSNAPDFEEKEVHGVCLLFGQAKLELADITCSVI